MIKFHHTVLGGEALKDKALNLIIKIKYELAVFILLCIQACMSLDFLNGMVDRFLVYYLADFSMAINSRLLIGSLVNLLTDHPTETWINCFAGIVLVLTLLFTSIIIGRIIRQTDEKFLPCILVLTLFFTSGSFTLYGFSEFFGLLDIYMYLFVVISALIVRNKYLKWLILPLCVCGMMINYAFPLSYFVFIALILLYHICTEEKKLGNIILLVVSCITVLALMIYCVFYAKNYTLMSFEEIWAIMEEKFGGELTYGQMRYYDYYLFGNEEQEQIMNIEMDGMTPIQFIKVYFRFMVEYGYNFTHLVIVLVTAIPVVAAFWYIWIKCIRASKTKTDKFIFACFILANLGIVACCILSTDLTRWFGMGITIQFGLCYYMFAMKNKIFEDVMMKIKETLKGKTVLVAAVYIAYASCGYFTITG